MIRQYDAVERVTDDIRRIFDFQRLEITAAPQRKTLVVSIDGKPYNLNELGAGFSQFLIVLGNAAIRKPTFILIDEPELNLHPSLQLDFLTALTSYSKDGTMFATHSVGLARSVAERIYSFQRAGVHSEVVAFEQTPNYVEFLGELSYSIQRHLGYEQILLVEGVHDVTTVQQLLRKWQKDHKVVLLPLGGSEMINGNRDHELTEICRLSNRIAVLIDSEREAAGQDLPANRAEFVRSCQSLGMRVCVTKFRAIESYFSDSAVKVALGNSYSALQPYQRLSEAPHAWSKRDNWRIARELTRNEIENSDVGEFLAAL